GGRLAGRRRRLGRGQRDGRGRCPGHAVACVRGSLGRPGARGGRLVNGEPDEVAGHRAPDAAPSVTAAAEPDTAALPADESLLTAGIDAPAAAAREAAAAACEGLAAADLLAMLAVVFPSAARAA